MSLRTPDWPRPLPTRVVLGLATLGPLGRLPAPGTWGSALGLLAVACAIRGRPWPGDGEVAALATALAWVAAGICGEAEVRLSRTDPPGVILDEFVAMQLCFLGWPALRHALPGWGVLLLGFGLFRFFDILKPLGIRRLQAFPGGWGVVIDDTAAAIATCAALHVIAWIVMASMA